MHASVHACMYVCMYVCMCMFRSSYMYRQMCSLNFSLLSCTHVQVYLQIISIYMYIYNTYMYMYIYLLTLLVIVSLCICLSTKKPLSTRTCNNIPKRACSMHEHIQEALPLNPACETNIAQRHRAQTLAHGSLLREC